MKRLLICFAALTFLAVQHADLAAQSNTRTGSYQSILSNSGVSSYNDGFSAPSEGYPGITASYRQDSPMAPAHDQLAPASPMTGATVGTSCDPGTINGSCDAGGCSSGYVGAGAPYCDSPVYDAGVGGIVGGAGGGSSRNWFFGVNGLIFDRDYEDDVYLTRDTAGTPLLSTDADSGTLGGLEFFLGSRSCNGNGFEARYWGLFADEATATLSDVSHQTYLTDLQNLYWPTSGEDLQTVFDRATSNTITRDNEIHNVEFNLLRQGGCYRTRWGQCATFELLHGFRWFEFDEEFHWDLTSGVAPTALFFDTDVQNTLLGYQLGSRSNVCLGRRLSLNWATKFGVFNNRARVRQSIVDGGGVYATVGSPGPDYNFVDTKNDVSLLGELDLGFSYNVASCSRVNIGYRAIGVSGIALAPNQFSNFNTLTPIRDVQSNGDLILHGAYVGVEFCK